MPKPSHAELTLLALLEAGPAHGYELVQRVHGMRIDQWARVPESTLYAVLRRMEERGWVEGETEPGERGRDRVALRRTEAGRKRLEALLEAGLTEPKPIYSDRLVAGVFAADRGRLDLLAACLADLRDATERLDAAARQTPLSHQGRTILRFYRGLAELHTEALEALREQAPER